MKIFVDESGIFRPSPNKEHGISAQGGLVIPNCKYSKIEKWFNDLTTDWPKDTKGEIKGSLLDEKHIKQIIPFLKRNDALFFVVVIDLNRITEEEITHHKAAQADRLIQPLTDQHYQSFVQQITEMSESLRVTSNQLYVQAVAMNKLISVIVRNSTLYYCQRKPSELGSFEWLIDAKNPTMITKFENLWLNITMPLLQTETLKMPFPVLQEGNYDYFNMNFKCEDVDDFDRETLVDELKPHLDRRIKSGSKRQIAIDTIMTKDIAFEPSHKHTGLLLVDILTNAIRRAIQGNMKQEAWLPIGEIMIPIKGQSINCITINDSDTYFNEQYKNVVMLTGSNGRAMIKTKKR